MSSRRSTVRSARRLDLKCVMEDSQAVALTRSSESKAACRSRRLRPPEGTTSQDRHLLPGLMWEPSSFDSRCRNSWCMTCFSARRTASSASLTLVRMTSKRVRMVEEKACPGAENRSLSRGGKRSDTPTLSVFRSLCACVLILEHLNFSASVFLTVSLLWAAPLGF